MICPFASQLQIKFILKFCDTVDACSICTLTSYPQPHMD
uniref:Uncharacterized protein n=1 Tax=Triticum urartu TaxID=4572 RepID=A0A8R7U0H3_TRIUA